MKNLNDQLEGVKEAFDRATAVAHYSAVDNGWWGARNDIVAASSDWAGAALGLAAQCNVTIAALGLICSEAGEAMEFVRTGDGSDDKLPQYRGVDVELVDIIIRALDLLGKREAPVGEILVAKLRKNAERGHMHGGKLA